MYSSLLILHSYFRWIVILALIIQFIWICRGHFLSKTFNNRDLKFLYALTGIFNIQFIIGLLLYFQSPIVDFFYQDIGKAVKMREVRFFGLEHITMMSLSIIWMNSCCMQVRKSFSKGQGFHYLWKRHIWIMIFILASIPWSFSPLTSRPNWR